jgi:hypothetical protein
MIFRPCAENFANPRSLEHRAVGSASRVNQDDDAGCAKRFADDPFTRTPADAFLFQINGDGDQRTDQQGNVLVAGEHYQRDQTVGCISGNASDDRSGRHEKNRDQHGRN